MKSVSKRSQKRKSNINNFLNDKSVKVGSTGAFGLYAVSWWLENKDNENYKGLK